MKLLLDQGLPRSTARLLREEEVDVVHAGECGLSRASDSEVLDFARAEGRIVVSLDSDFHALLVLSNAAGPSVIRIRIEGLRSQEAATLICKVPESCREDLSAGCVISVQEDRIRIRKLPVVSPPRRNR